MHFNLAIKELEKTVPHWKSLKIVVNKIENNSKLKLILNITFSLASKCRTNELQQQWLTLVSRNQCNRKNQTVRKNARVN